MFGGRSECLNLCVCEAHHIFLHLLRHSCITCCYHWGPCERIVSRFMTERHRYSLPSLPSTLNRLPSSHSFHRLNVARAKVLDNLHSSHINCGCWYRHSFPRNILYSNLSESSNEWPLKLIIIADCSPQNILHTLLSPYAHRAMTRTEKIERKSSAFFCYSWSSLLWIYPK